MLDVTFNSLSGNDGLKETLKKTIMAGKLHHSYIIEGVDDSRQALARIIAAAHNCKAENKPCGECIACKKISNSTHPDIFYIDLLKDKKTVGVGQIKEIVKDIYIAPNEADKKVYIFNCSEDLTVQSQNTLLKILEEPPSFVCFVLILKEGAKLLDTIYSRSVLLYVLPQNKDENISSKQLQKSFNTFEKFLNLLIGKSESDFLKMAGEFSTKEKYADFLEGLSHFMRDILIFRETENEELLFFFTEQLKISDFSDKITNRQIAKISDFIKKASDALEINCNLALWANSFFIKCWEEVH